MSEVPRGLDAIFETTIFLGYFNDLDHHRPGKVVYPLNEILLLSLLAVLTGAESFTNIAGLGEMTHVRSR